MSYIEKIFVFILLSILSQFCIGSKKSDSTSFLSVSGLLTSNPQGSSSASGPPKYGRQPEGVTPTTKGIPTSVMETPTLNTGYQTNLNVLDLLGIFYHKNPNFPEVRQITDVSVVKLEKNLEKSEQLDWDFNQFILDGKMGLILFTRGLQQLDYIQNTELKGAKHISVLANGKIAILDTNEKINLCYSFDGNTITRKESCVTSERKAVKIAPHLKDSFIYFDSVGSFFSIHSETLENTALDFKKNLPNPISISTSEDVVLVIYDNGSSIIAFLDKGKDSDSRFEEKANTNLIQIAKDGNLNNLTSPLRVTSIVRSYEGRYYAYSPDLNSLIGFAPNLKVYNKVWDFPSLPIPFYRMKNVVGLQLHPNSRLIHVYDSYAIHIFSETSIFEREDLGRHIPPAFDVILQVMGESINVNTYDPAKNLFKYPEVEQVLKIQKQNYL